jgi:hypothetical protein
MKNFMRERAIKQIGIETFNEITQKINGLTKTQKRNICDKCHKRIDCQREHSNYLHDTGVCDFCGRFGDVANCSIAMIVEDYSLDERVYWESGLPRIFRQGQLEIDLNQLSFD